MGQKKDDAPPTCVFKIHMYCDGCAKEIREKVLKFSGVEDVKVDLPASELTVFGKVDPAMILDRLKEEFPKKEVQIVSPKPKKGDGGGSKDNKDQDRKRIENESSKVNREMKKKDKLIKRLTQELENGRIRAEKDSQEKDELIQKLELKCQETSERANRQFEEKERLLDYTLNAVTSAPSSSSNAQNESTKVKRETKKMEERIKRLTQELEDARNEAQRLTQELEDARNDAARARNEAEFTVIQVEQISQELDEARNETEVTVIQAEQISQQLEEARNEAARERNEADNAQDCAICQTNKKDMAFGCGHVTCEECGRMLSTCHICREPITTRIKLFFE